MALSFEESKKQLAAQAATPMMMSMRAVAAPADEPIAAYAGNETWEKPANAHFYEYHNGEYSDEDYSIVDAEKNVVLSKMQINLTQENNSQYIPFEIPRHYDGFDLSTTQLSFYWVNKNGEGSFALPVDVYCSADKIRMAWLIDDNVTMVAGKVKFEIQASGKNSLGNDYVWKTRPNDGLNVLQSLYFQTFVKPDESWQTDFVGKIAAEKEAAQAAASAAQTVLTEVQALKDSTQALHDGLKDGLAEEAANAVAGVLGDYALKSDIPSLNGYATEQYVQDEIAKVDVTDQLPKNLSDLAEDETHRVVTDAEKEAWNAKSEFSGAYADLTGAPTDISTFNNDAGYLTEHQSLEGYATETYVKDEIEKVDVSGQLTDYAKSADVYTKTEVDEAISNVEVDLSDYYTKTEVDTKTSAIASTAETASSGVSSLSETVTELQTTVNSIDTSPRLTYDVKYNDTEDADVGENVFALYEITNEGKEGEVREIKQKFTIVGGGGGTSASSTLKIGYVTTSPFVVTINDKAVIKYTFSGTDSSGDAVTEGNATWKIAGRVIATGIALAGENEFDITDHLSIGTQKVNLTITDDAGSLVSKNWTVQKIDVRLESSFNDKITYPVGKVSFDYTPYGAIAKTVHFKLDGKELGVVETTSSGIPMAYEIPAQAHGAHLLESYMTAEVNGNTIESNHIVKDIMWYDASSDKAVIGTIYQKFTARQYDTTNIVYTVYDPTTETPTVEIAVDGVVVSTPTLTEATNTYSYKTDVVGDHVITIKCGEVVKTLTATITKLDINVAPVTAGLVFDFNPSGKSNNDADRVWSDGEVAMSVSDNFDWVNGGYQYDENGDQYFCIKAGTSAEINYLMFADDAKRNGKEMKLVFKTTNVQEANAQFMSCVDNTTGSDHIGIDMFVHEAYIYGSADQLHLKYSENDIIEFEFNITKDTEGVTEICGYEDGVATRHLVYDDSFGFTQAVPKTIALGSEKCDLHIYRFKVYNTSLTDRGILSNFIADARNAEEMISRYNRNQIYDENQNLTPETLAEKCPWLRVYVVSAPYFTNKKSDKVPYTTIKQIYKNGDPILDNWVCYDCQHSGQGTSSDNYGASARNLDFIMNKSGVDGVDPYFILGDGSTRATKVSLTRTSIPNAYFNFKANVASSNHFTNALLAKRYNTFNPYVRAFVREDESIIEYIKDTMEFHNAVVFIQETDTDLSTHREFADTDVHFYSIGNIGDSKKTDKTRLTDPTDRYEFVNEICDVELPLSDWPNTPEAIAALEAEKFDKSGSYEWRYIWEDGTDEENAAVFDYCKQKWIDMYKFVVQSTDEEFKAHFADYFVLDSVLYYYLFTTRYCMVDNRAKNSFWHYGKTGEVDGSGNPIRKFDLCFMYDCDSSMSLNNYGNSVYRHGYEDTDTMDGTNEEVFRESDSTFFCRVRDLFGNELKALYNTLESKNAWHAESFLNEIEAWQKQFPEELWRLDCQRKYVRTVNSSFISGAGDPQYLKNMAQGRMLYPVKQWERSQEAYMASKYQSSVATSDNAVLRCTVPTGNLVVPVNYKLKITPYDYIYLNVMYGTQDRIQVRALPGVQYEIPFEGSSVDIIDISSASRLQDLGDLSSTYPATVDTAKAIRLKELHVGNSIEGYDNPYLTTITLGANYLLEVLNLENVSGLTQSLNLTALNNLRELYAHGTNTGGVTFADGGRIEIAELPAINALTMKNLMYLATFDVADFSKLTMLTVENCSTVDLLTILDSAPSVNRIRLVGIDWSLEDTTLLERLYHMKGFDKNGYNAEQSVLTGHVHVPVMKEKVLADYNAAWPDLDITYNTLVQQFSVTFQNDDGTVLDVQYVDKGTAAVDPITRGENPIATPTKESSVSTDYTFVGWDKVLSDAFDNQIITATYSETIRKYTIKYVSRSTVLKEVVAEYGSTVLYDGAIPTYTMEESAYKYYLFDKWDQGGYVSGNKTISAVYDSCEYKDGYFVGKELSEMRPVEFYMMTKLGSAGVISLADYISAKDSFSISLGSDVSYNDVEEHILIETPVEFNGTNHIDTNIALLSEDRDFVLAIDYKMGTNNAANAVLAQCFSGLDTSGFKLIYNSGTKLAWGGSSINPSGSAYREMLVIRHLKGENGLHVYASNIAGTSTYYVEMSGAHPMIHDVSLVFGCSKLEDGSYEQNATGTVYWSKLWYADLGHDVCNKIAYWPHEEMAFEACCETNGNLKRYYLSDNSGARSSITFIAANTLAHSQTLSDAGSNAGGWAQYPLNTYLNTRLYKAFPDAWKQLMKQVKIKSSAGNKSNEIVNADCYIFIPSASEVDASYTIEPYASEGTLISHLSSQNARVCRKPDGTAVQYWLRSPNSGYTNYVYRVNASGGVEGITLPYTTGIYVRIMISM